MEQDGLRLPSRIRERVAGLDFCSDFDSGNLARVEALQPSPAGLDGPGDGAAGGADPAAAAGPAGLPPGSTMLAFRLWTARDNAGTDKESRHAAWFHFTVSGLNRLLGVQRGSHGHSDDGKEAATHTADGGEGSDSNAIILRMTIMNSNKHELLYKYDHRPVYCAESTGNEWRRLRSSVRVREVDRRYQLTMDHRVDPGDDSVSFAFTFPHSYQDSQKELAAIDAAAADLAESHNVFYMRQLLARSLDGRRVELLTITDRTDGLHELDPATTPSQLHPQGPASSPAQGHGQGQAQGQSLSVEREPPLTEEEAEAGKLGCPIFRGKDIIFVSARVHPGEVSASHAFRGVLRFLLDPDDPRAQALRKLYVFKLVPMINPDGVARGHFRMDQNGINLNRCYANPSRTLHPSVFAIRSLVQRYCAQNSLVMTLDLHGHATKRGCFIYGNVMEDLSDQVQNQLYCRLIAMNTPHFDYEYCLFSKDHMQRVDPGDNGASAAGSARVSTYLGFGLIHSYTLECHYNVSRASNVLPPIQFPRPRRGGGNSKKQQRPPGPPLVGEQEAPAAGSENTAPQRMNPESFMDVGQACMVALLDLRSENPLSRVPNSKYRTLDRLYQAVCSEVRARPEFREQSLRRRRQQDPSAPAEVKRSRSREDNVRPQQPKDTAAPARRGESRVSVGPGVVPNGVANRRPHSHPGSQQLEEQLPLDEVAGHGHEPPRAKPPLPQRQHETQRQQQQSLQPTAQRSQTSNGSSKRAPLAARGQSISRLSREENGFRRVAKRAAVLAGDGAVPTSARSVDGSQSATKAGSGPSGTAQVPQWSPLVTHEQRYQEWLLQQRQQQHQAQQGDSSKGPENDDGLSSPVPHTRLPPRKIWNRRGGRAPGLCASASLPTGSAGIGGNTEARSPLPRMRALVHSQDIASPTSTARKDGTTAQSSSAAMAGANTELATSAGTDSGAQISTSQLAERDQNQENLGDGIIDVLECAVQEHDSAVAQGRTGTVSISEATSSYSRTSVAATSSPSSMASYSLSHRVRRSAHRLESGGISLTTSPANQRTSASARQSPQFSSPQKQQQQHHDKSGSGGAIGTGGPPVQSVSELRAQQVRRSRIPLPVWHTPKGGSGRHVGRSSVGKSLSGGSSAVGGGSPISRTSAMRRRQLGES